MLRDFEGGLEARGKAPRLLAPVRLEADAPVLEVPERLAPGAVGSCPR